MELSLVVPARNERPLIRESLLRISNALRALDVEHEILVGDSGSTDGTGDEALAVGLDTVRVVRDPLPGKGRILTRALAATRGEVVGFIDADLEIDESHIAELYHQVVCGADAAVAAKRTDPEAVAHRPLHRRMITATLNRILRLVFQTSISDHQAGLKLFRGTQLRSLLPRVRNTGWLWDTEVLVYLARGGARIAEVPVTVTQRAGSHLRFGLSWLAAGRDLTALFVRSRLAWKPAPTAVDAAATESPIPL